MNVEILKETEISYKTIGAGVVSARFRAITSVTPTGNSIIWLKDTLQNPRSKRCTKTQQHDADDQSD